MKHIIKFFILFIFSSIALSGQENENETPTGALASEDSLIAYIHGLHEKVLGEGLTTDNFSESDLGRLPIGIYHEVGNQEYIVLIDSAVFTPTGAYFSAFVSLDVPNSTQKLAFRASRIEFTPGGLTTSDMAKLYLVSDHSVKIGNHATLELNGSNQKTYVSWDCNGFQGVNLFGKVRFSRDLMLPEDQNGNIINDKYVETSFEIFMSDWNDFLIDVNLPPFQPKEMPGFSFAVTNAVFDMSEEKNSSDMIMPQEYMDIYGAMPQLWKGFFLKSLTVRLPGELTKGMDRKRLDATSMIIDRHGLTGNFGAANIIQKEDKGNIAGWAFTIDSVGVSFMMGAVKGAAMKGDIKLPIMDEEAKSMEYTALLARGADDKLDYLFQIKTMEEIQVGALSGRMKLAPNSSITLEKVNGEFKAQAMLHGAYNLSMDEAEVKELEFQNLHLVSEKPYLLGGTFNLGGESGDESNSIGTFPITLHSVSFVNNQQSVKLNIDASVNLMNKSDKGFAARANIGVETDIEGGEVNSEGEKEVQKWKLKRAQVNNIYINVATGAFTAKGELSIYRKDKVYGDGIRGFVDLTVEPSLAAKATAQFGRVEGLRYWYIDCNVRLPKPVGGPIGFFGFGGGLYYHMENQAVANLGKYGSFDMPDSVQVGQSLSGAKYIPNKEIGIGAKFMTTLGLTANSKAFNADATFEMAFNESGGLRYVLLEGDGYLLTDINDRSGGSPLYASLMMVYDNPTKTFHSNVSLFVNVEEKIIGVNENYLAGSLIIHSDPQDWYIHAGTPEQPIGLNFMGLAKATSYFMAGTVISDFPELPSNVTKIIGDIDMSLGRDLNQLASGGGLAFGAAIDVNTGRQEFAIFYGSFALGLGFDVMIKDYGPAARCSGSTEPIGINGWYATGQAWAYVSGSIGVFVDKRWFKGEFEILRIGAAVVLQARLPNPVWMQGVVGGEFSILGGLVKGNCRFKVEVGERCEIVGGALNGVKVISDMKPDGEDVSVFSSPQVAFNTQINTKFEMLTDTELNAYKIRLDKIELIAPDGSVVSGDIKWNERKDVATFLQESVLEGKAKYKMKVKVVWQHRKNGSWTDLKFGDQLAFEEEEISFVTGEAPDYIPESNVKYAYPVNNMYNFYQDEYGQAYIQLNMAQDAVFAEEIDGVKWNYSAVFASADGFDRKEVGITYSPENRGIIRLSIPDNLLNATAYKMVIVRKPAQNYLSEGNVIRDDKQVYSDGEIGGEVSTSNNKLAGVIIGPGEKEIYSLRFRTSRFNTFVDKMNNLSSEESIGRILQDYNVIRLGYRTTSDEVFGRFEKGGSDGIRYTRLIEIEGLADNPWMNNFVLPKIYDPYPKYGSSLTANINTFRSPAEELGIPPVKSVFVYQDQYPVLTESSFESTSGSIGGITGYIYDLPFYVNQDYNKIYNYLMANYKPSTSYPSLLKVTYENIYTGSEYGFKMKYVLPGTGKVTSTKTFKIKW
ncbi:hypothetical protein [Marinigracilibium pacificum]|uniref:Uncharacterized protein n=1 Tax=Marinigracilibium pacificum TaxID=2729599 RepID=A0A848J4S6_9BACT|nr:hypothetical protein [Marinigracilibium pacificum]NMM50485.1 hypothetical protein [Marinigracilibium pacificum]